MRKRYELNGKKYNVNIDSEKGKAWLAKNTEAILIGTIVPKKEQSSATGATQEQETSAPEAEANQPQNNTELTSEDGSSELAEEDKKLPSIWQRLSKAFDDGVKDTDNIRAKRELFEEGVDTSDETIQQLIVEHQRLANTEPSEGMKKFMEAYNREYDERIEEDPDSSPGFWSFVNAFKEQPGVGSEVFVRSMASQLAALRDDDIRQKTELAAVTAGGGALALGQAGPQVALPEELITVPSAMYIAGMGTLTYQMETANSAVEFLLEELEQGQEFTLGNARKILEDPEKAQRIKNRARARGATIGTFEALAGMIAPGVTKAARGFRKTGQAVAGITTEAVMGGAGEVAGRIAADQDMDPVEVGFETIAGTTTAPFTVAPALVGDIKNRPAYSFKDKDGNVEIVSKKEMQNFLNTATDEELSMANLKIDNDVDLADVAAGKINNAVLESQIDERVTDKSDRVKLVDLEKQRIKADADAKKKGISQVPNAKDNLENIESQINEIVDKYSTVDRRTKPVRDIKNRAKQVIETVAERKFQQNMEFAKKHSQIYGLEIDDTMTNEDIISKYGDEAKGAAGFVVDDKIIINKEVAKNSVNGDNVANHELLHGILKSSKANITQDLVNDFMSKLSQSDQNVINKRLQDNYDADYIKNNLDEYFTAASDAIANGEIKFNESIFSSIKDTIRRVFQDLGIGITVDFETGQGVYNFLKDYNISIHKGALSKGITKVTKGKATFDDAKASRDAKIPIDKLGKLDSDGNDMSEAGMGNFLYQAESDQVISKIKEEGYLDNLIASKYKVRPVPQDFVQDVLAELTPHIKAFKPEQNDSLFGWIQGQLANKAGSVYNKIYKDKGPARTVDVDATTSEGAPLVQIEADTDAQMERIDEIGLNDTEVQERSRFRRSLKLDDTMVDKVINTVKKAFGTKLPNVNTKQFKQALVKSFKTDLKKPMQDLMGKGEAYNNFLKKFMPAIYKHLPVEVLVQMERNLKPDQRIFTSSRRITKPIEVDKLISEGRLPKDTSRTSGPDLNTKLPYPGNESILAFFRGTNSEEVLGYKKGASTYGTRKDVLAERTITEVAFDAVSTVIQDPKVSSKIEDLNIAGIDKVENDLAIIAKQIDRDPTIKFSRSAIGVKKENVPVFSSKFNQVLNKINSNETLPTDKKGLKKIIKDIYDGDLDNSEMNAVVNKIIRYSTDFLDQKAKTRNLTDVDVKLTDYILEASEKDVVDKSTYQLFSELLPSGYKNVAAFFNDKARVNKARSALGSFAQSLRDSGLSKNEILRLLDTQYKGMYASSSKIAAGQFSVEFVDGAYVVVKGDGKVGTHRGQVFQNVADFYRVAGYPNYKQDLKSVNTKTFAETSKAAVADKNYNGRLKQAKEARQAVLKIMDYYFGKIKNGELDYGDAIMLAKMFMSNMNSPMKRAANLTYIAEGVESISPKDMGRLTEYEHIVPTSVMVLKLFTAYIKDGKASESIFNGYEVAIIPKSMDKVLIKNGLRDFLPITYKEGDANWKRYFNKQTLGENNLVPIVDIKTGEIIGTDFVKASNILTSGSINQKGAQLVGKVGIKYSKSKPKGMSTFDFDETLIIDGKNFIIATDPNTGDKVKISSEEWPLKGPDYADAGFEFDFSDFANVRGGKEGPLLQKMKNQITKYGNKNVFVLTARQQVSAEPIKQWLKSKGIDIPLRNITGLGKSEGSAKGEWMLQKFAEGYNDMYFVDDALSNVEAVRKVLDQLDIKSKVVQAKIKFSKDASRDFNKMIERSKGVLANREFSAAEARKIGAKNNKIRFFVPPSAEDFKGLVYSFLGKGTQGDKDMSWFKQNLFDPFAKGIGKMDTVKQRMTDEYKNIKKSFPTVIKSLNNEVAGTSFTTDDAIRVYLWKNAGFNIPGMSDAQVDLLVDYVAKDANLTAFADSLSRISRRPEGYVKPSDYWTAESIGSDLSQIANEVNRSEFLAEWIENKNIVFSAENLNKIEAIYGSNFREQLETMLTRMETGTNRPTGLDKNTNRMLNWINGSVGAVMFFNTRSAVLQTLSMANFINFEDNNIFAAAKAFANQKQFWSDFATLYNSNMLKQRRAGLKIDVSASELTDAFAKGKSKAEAVISYLLQKGFTPTQVADSFAIASGGSTFYRNKIKKYIKQGMSKAEAENQAFLDFQEIAEETQQSSRPDLISNQQSGVLGRLILAWANTPMQMTRLTKKALSDLVNRRGDTKANISKIMYYGLIQNLIFGSLQTGLAFLAFGSEDDEEKTDTKQLRVLNGVFDTLLRGTGIWGAAASTLKNVIMQTYQELGKGFGKTDYSKISQKLFDVSPPIGSKHRKIISAIKTYDWNEEVIEEMDHGVNNPGWNVFASLTEGLTNIPTARILNKAKNLRLALEANIEPWQRAFLTLGWDSWSMDIEDEELKQAREDVKQKRKDKKVDKQYRCRANKKSGGRCKNRTDNKNKKCYAHQ